MDFLADGLVAFTTEDLYPALRILGQLHYVM